MQTSTGETAKHISIHEEVGEDELSLEESIYDPNQLNPADLAMLNDDFKRDKSELMEQLSDMESASLTGFLAGKTYQEIADSNGTTFKQEDNSLLRVRTKSRKLKDLTTKPTIETIETTAEPPAGKRGEQSTTLEEAFWRHVEKREDGCWFWTGIRREHGVCQLSFGKKMYTGLRLSWELAGNQPAPRKGLRRLCNEPYCVNPEHHELRDCFKPVEVG